MNKRVEALLIATLLLVPGCLSIGVPEAILQQNKQREDAFILCKEALDRIEAPSDSSKANLDACYEHRRIADSILDMFRAKPRLNLNEAEFVLKIVNDNEVSDIRTCYALVKLGQPIPAYEGRTGIAVCDRWVDERRHRQTLKAIEAAGRNAYYRGYYGGCITGGGRC